MKKLFTSAFLLALTFGAANAQQPEGKEKTQRKEHRKEHKSHAKLNLTEDQKAQVKALRENYKKQAGELNKESLPVEERKDRRKELHQQYRSKFEAILTPAQKSQVAEMKAERKASHKTGKFQGEKRKKDVARKHAGSKKGEFRGKEAMAKKLDLTTEQQQKMKEIRTGYKSKMESLRKDDALSREQKKTKFQELRKAQKEEMKTVLTKEQVRKIQSLRKQHTSKNTR